MKKSQSSKMRQKLTGNFKCERYCRNTSVLRRIGNVRKILAINPVVEKKIDQERQQKLLQKEKKLEKMLEFIEKQREKEKQAEIEMKIIS